MKYGIVVKDVGHMPIKGDSAKPSLPKRTSELPSYPANSLFRGPEVNKQKLDTSPF